MIIHHDKQHQLEGGLPTTAVPPWMLSAVCAQTDSELFFPDKGESNRAAKQICAGCPVRDECLEHAMEHGEPFGVWGGLSEHERRGLTRTRADYTHHCVCGARFRSAVSLAAHRATCRRKAAA